MLSDFCQYNSILSLQWLWTNRGFYERHADVKDVYEKRINGALLNFPTERMPNFSFLFNWSSYISVFFSRGWFLHWWAMRERMQQHLIWSVLQQDVWPVWMPWSLSSQYWKQNLRQRWVLFKNHSQFFNNTKTLSSAEVVTKLTEKEKK